MRFLRAMCRARLRAALSFFALSFSSVIAFVPFSFLRAAFLASQTAMFPGGCLSRAQTGVPHSFFVLVHRIQPIRTICDSLLSANRPVCFPVTCSSRLCLLCRYTRSSGTSSPSMHGIVSCWTGNLPSLLRKLGAFRLASSFRLVTSIFPP